MICAACHSGNCGLCTHGKPVPDRPGFVYLCGCDCNKHCARVFCIACRKEIGRADIDGHVYIHDVAAGVIPQEAR